MENEKVFAMSFGKVYQLLVAKAKTELTYGDFFWTAPAMNPNRDKITGYGGDIIGSYSKADC